MLWLKRNLFLVVFIAVSVVLLGGAGFYLYMTSEESFAQDDELDKLKQELEQLKQDVFPSEANIAIVRSNIALHAEFMGSAEKVLAAPEVPKSGNSFSVTLARVLDEMRREATNAQVEIPPRYEFTFGEVKTMPQIPAYAVEPLAVRLAEVRMLCNVIFKARLRSLDRLERVVAYDGEKSGADLLTDRIERTNTITTNLAVTATPYRLVFRGFSSDLSAVLNGFASTKEFITVRQVDVEPASGGMDAPGMPAPGGMSPFGVGGMQPPGMLPAPAMLAPVAAPPGAAPGVMQPGGVPRPGGGVPVRPGFTNAVPAKPRYTKVLDEKLLRCTISLDVLKAIRKASAAPAPAPGAPAAPATTAAPAPAATPAPAAAAK